MFNIITKHFPSLDIHASTQLTTHNVGQIPFLKKLGASRVNLSRELNLREITAINKVCLEHDVLTEVFVHGSLCVAFSGLCYSTSASVGNSGNRGRCSQACREEYETTPSGHNFPLNIKDNSAFFDLPALIDAGVHSFKIEGRIKGANYVHTVVDSFRKQIDGFLNTGELTEDGERLYKVFNRDFSNAFLSITHVITQKLMRLASLKLMIAKRFQWYKFKMLSKTYKRIKILLRLKSLRKLNT